MKKTITSETAIYGIIGKPVNHSLSPTIHNTVFQLAGIDAVYLPFSVDASRLGDAATGLRTLSISGVNVTIPHKETIIPYLDQLDETAANIGAVNTITIRDGRLLGSNTDWSGFIDSLERHRLKVDNSRVAVLGSGGSARAVLYALGKKNCKEIEIFNRTFEKAEALAERFNQLFPSSRFEAWQLEDFFQDEYRQVRDEIPELVIDTLPRTMPFNPPRWLWHKRQAVYYTINYGSAAANKNSPAGWRYIEGLDMLICQAMRSFLLWMGELFSPTTIRELYGQAYKNIRSGFDLVPYS